MTAAQRSIRPGLWGRLRVSARLSAMASAVAVCALLAGTGAKAQLAYSSGNTNLGSVAVGAAPVVSTITFTVAAGNVTTIGGIQATADGSTLADFNVTAQTCNGTLSGPASCTVRVSFAPTQRGLRKGALTISQTGSNPVVVYLQGIGLGSQLVFSPDTATATSTVTPLSPVFYSPSTLVYDAAGNLYFNDFLNSRILEQSSAGVLSVVASLPGNIMQMMAINGAGTLYISAPTQGHVVAVKPGVSTTILSTPGVTIVQPSGIAIDGSGNVYIADAALNQIVRTAADGSSATVLALTGLSTPLLTPEGVALDAAGNLYIVDSGNGRVVKVVLSTLAATVVPVAGTLLSNAYGIAVDASGTLYIDDTGNRRILRVPPTGSASAILTPNYSFSAPTGVAVAANGDLVVADNNNGIVRITRATPTSPLTFTASTPVGTLDNADGVKSATLQNIGNVPLQFTVPSGTATNPTVTNSAFSVSSTSTCPLLTSTSSATSGQIAAGVTCTVGVTFTPTVLGPNTGALNIVSSPTGAAGPVTSSVALAGTGRTAADTLTLTATPTTSNVGSPVTLTVAALLAGAPATGYGGTITLSSTDSTATYPSGTTYTFTAADAGTHVFSPGIVFGQTGTFTISAKDGTFIANATVIVKGALITPVISLTSTPNPASPGATVTFSAAVTSTAGTPTGQVVFYDGANAIGTGTIVGGIASIATSFTTPGLHNITAQYSGDPTFSAVTSTVLVQTISDFTLVLASGSSSALTVPTGTSGAFTFAVAPVTVSTFAAPVTFSVTGLPAGIDYTFTPTSLSAGTGPSNVTLTINVPAGFVTGNVHSPWHGAPFERAAPVLVALLLMPMLSRRGRRSWKSLLLVLVMLGAAVGFTGCLSDQASGYYGTRPHTYPLTVTATSAGVSHSVAVSLTVQ
jgi:sugar lactone lactonase YvrE